MRPWTSTLLSKSRSTSSARPRKNCSLPRRPVRAAQKKVEKARKELEKAEARLREAQERLEGFSVARPKFGSRVFYVDGAKVRFG